MPSIQQIEVDLRQTKRDRAKSLSCLQHLKTDPEEMKFGIESEKAFLRQKTEPMSYRSDMTSNLTDIWLSDRLSDEEFIMKMHQLSTKIDKTVPKRCDQGSSYKESLPKRRRFRQSVILYTLFLYPSTIV